MNAATASIALALVQFCGGVVMAGLFLNMPREHCTRQWALSGGLSASGICIMVAGYTGLGGAWNALLLLMGNTSLFAGCLSAWSGLRSFYQRRTGRWPLLMVGVYAFLFSLMLLYRVSFTNRAYLAMFALQMVFWLVLIEFVRGMSGPGGRRYGGWSFGRCIGIFSLFIFITTHLARFVLSFSQPELFIPPAMSTIGVALIYMIPLCGSLLFSVSLMMIYFERLLADKQRLATEDELTGTLNRRELVRCGELALAQAVQARQRLTLAFIDVDHFKRINDTHGHLAGDRVLADIGILLRKHCAQGGLIGRYGGEEFCAVFFGWSEEQARVSAQHLLETVRNHVFVHGQEVTISVGLAVLQPGQVMSWDQLVHEADQALYRAKSEGRNAFRMALAA
ncbi:GGDEF domain-containing protein [Herbaspirillum rubrisubalbicans]|uniref:GGDEF domain-containing protein n=1 Tax=Herbaspirillum rubrisubalbicans TaxID=80842 RepID=UPI001558614A|nr:GGDEF domain-containing protein [Herbaspirillum rubrisubalbicans]NQE50717.1 membrane protein [Herbaspirillum rubrisubalbicans]